LLSVSKPNQAVEKVAAERIGSQKQDQNKAKTLQIWGFRALNGAQKRARRGFSTRWTVFGTGRLTPGSSFIEATRFFQAQLLRQYALSGASAL
jgi:hypothetical protein